MKKFKCLLCGTEFNVKKGEDEVCPACFQTGAVLQLLEETEDVPTAEIDAAALFKIGYGLYVLTTKSNERDNGMITNSVMQLTTVPNRVAVAVNKSNYSHDIIKNSGVMNINCLTEKTPFEVFERYGFKSGRDTDKFDGVSINRSANGLVVLEDNINAFFSLAVEQTVDLDTHTLFICALTEAKVISNDESMTYAYYHKNVKPKPQAKTEDKTGFVCKICGHVYEGETLPEDYICPICKHPASDFEPIK